MIDPMADTSGIPTFIVFVWLDGQPNEGDAGDSVARIKLHVYDNDLLETIRLVGVSYAAQRGRPVKVSVYNTRADSWAKPSGTPIDKFAAYSLELDVRCGDVRV